MLIKIGATLKDISNFVILLFLFLFIYTILGMELFAYKIRFDEDNNPIDLSKVKPGKIFCFLIQFRRYIDYRAKSKNKL